jgi:hypothetical protein
MLPVLLAHISLMYLTVLLAMGISVVLVGYLPKESSIQILREGGSKVAWGASLGQETRPGGLKIGPACQGGNLGQCTHMSVILVTML